MGLSSRPIVWERESLKCGTGQERLEDCFNMADCLEMRGLPQVVQVRRDCEVEGILQYSRSSIGCEDPSHIVQNKLKLYIVIITPC